jgi:hypothetical protein
MKRLPNATREREEYDDIRLTFEIIKAGRRELFLFDPRAETPGDAATRIF